MTKNIDMTVGKPLKLILSFAVPMLIGNIFQQVYSLTDAAIVGKFVGANALASVGATSSMTFFLISWIIGFTRGAGVIFAQFYGAGRNDNLRKTLSTLIFVISGMTILITVFGCIASKPMLRLLSTPDSILDSSAMYLKIVFLGTAGTALYNTCATALNSIGDSKTPIYAIITAAILNTLLDLLFVLKFNWGVNGSAIATVISQLVSGFICLGFIIFKQPVLHIMKEEFKFDKIMFANIIKMGVPTALQSSLISIGGMSVQRLINSCGTATVAAYTAANKIDSLAIQPIVTMGMAMSVFTAQNIGAKQIERIRLCLKQTLTFVVFSSVILACCIILFRTQLLCIFLDKATDIEAVRIGEKYLCIVGIAYISAGIMQTYLNILKGAGDINVTMWIGLVELGSRILFAYTLVLLFNLGSTGIWLSTPLSWITACVITVIRYCSGKWKTKSVI